MAHECPFSQRSRKRNSYQLYKSKLIQGRFSEPVNLGDVINTKYNEGDTFIAPDESYLLVTCKGRPDQMGGNGIFISFKKTYETDLIFQP